MYQALCLVQGYSTKQDRTGTSPLEGYDIVAETDQ